MTNENLLTRQVEEYIAYKRNLGYKILIEAQELRRFAAFTRDIGHDGSLTTELSMRWAALKEEYSLFYKARRLETIHTFAKYISVFDTLAQIPKTGVFGKAHCRTSPYIYSDEEISMLMEGANNLFSPDGIRSYTTSTAIGLLRSTGIRVSELTSLRIEDVNLDSGYLFIHNSKFKKERVVPLHTTAAEELSRYRIYIADRFGPREKGEYFFISSYGQRFSTRSFEYAFFLIRPVLYRDSMLESGKENRMPRLYDIRHTFACKTVERWLKSGEDVNQKLYLPSTYLGHVKPEDTYWYLSATPGLLNISCIRYEEAFGEGAVG